MSRTSKEAKEREQEILEGFEAVFDSVFEEGGARKEARSVRPEWYTVEACAASDYVNCAFGQTGPCRTHAAGKRRETQWTF